MFKTRGEGGVNGRLNNVQKNYKFGDEGLPLLGLFCHFIKEKYGLKVFTNSFGLAEGGLTHFDELFPSFLNP